MAKLRLTSVVFCTKFIFAKKSVGNVKHCTILRGFQKGDRNPTSVVAGEGSQGEGESKHPLPVRVFGDFLRVEKVTPRSASAVRHCEKVYTEHEHPAQHPAAQLCENNSALRQNCGIKGLHKGEFMV